MANCQITSNISGKCGPSRKTEDVIIPEGHVGQVCKEWLIREDGNLAYRLQNEEISQHYQGNRSKNRIVREDIPLAKELQKHELYEASNRIRSHTHATNAANNDEHIARQIERRLWLEEEISKKAIEEADERLAKKLIEKEKARQSKKRLLKEKQQVKELSALIGAEYGPESIEISEYTEDTSFMSQPPFQRILTEDDQELDLSEFCMPPPPGLTPDELKLFLEEQDAEIARLLQHQELKRNKNPEKEKLALIEAQDREIAKMLQRQERERARRAKERSRLKQQRQQSDNEERSNEFQTDLHFSELNINYQRTSTPISPQNSIDNNKVNTAYEENEYDIPENYLVKENNEDETYEEPYRVAPPPPQLNEVNKPFYNIAMDLDPTYQRRKPEQSQSQNNLLESCVDDDEVPIGATNSLNSQNRDYSKSRSQDCLNKFNSKSSANQSPVECRAQTIRDDDYSSKDSTRSSYTSSSSASHRSNRSLNEPSRMRPVSTIDINDDNYAPPLPPRDGSLLARSRLESNSVSPHEPSNYLPPHHPQHPNRRTNSQSPLQMNYSSNNRNSIYSVSNLPIQGQRRVLSMEKQKKEKHRNQDGCRTQ